MVLFCCVVLCNIVYISLPGVLAVLLIVFIYIYNFFLIIYTSKGNYCCIAY